MLPPPRGTPDLRGSAWPAPRRREHRGERVVLVEVESGGPRQDGEPLVPRVHADPPRGATSRDPHLRDDEAVWLVLSGEQPRGATVGGVAPGVDDDVVVSRELDELVDGRAEGTGDGGELVDRDPPVPRLDAAERRGTEATPPGERVEGPAAGEP